MTAARLASQNEARVLFLMGDNADHASLCINAVCMPSKALFEPIDAMHHAKLHGWLEVKPKQPNEYLGQIMRWKDNQIEKFRAYRQKEIRDLASETFSIVRSNACFVGDHEVVSEDTRHTFDAATTATGSVTVAPKIKGSTRLGTGFRQAMRFCTTPASRNPLRSSASARSGSSYLFVMRGLARRSH